MMLCHIHIAGEGKTKVTRTEKSVVIQADRGMEMLSVFLDRHQAETLLQQISAALSEPLELKDEVTA